MNKKIEDAFKQAYADVPSQDNEGYVPDRGSFKCGFVLGAEFALREAIEILGNEYDENKLSLKFESKQAACDALDIAIQKLEQLLSSEGEK